MVDTYRARAGDQQGAYDIRFEWGIDGVESLGPSADVIIVIDTLSFSTAVEVAVSRGASVYPFRFRDPAAEAFAEKMGARLAVSRSKVSAEHPLSLSPQAMLGAQAGEKIVLPSPNGARLSLRAADLCGCVLCGCLRNAAAVAATARECGRKVLVAAAGELWRGSSGELRPALEDLLGAGCILSQMRGRLSPEAYAAAQTFRAVSSEVERLLLDCVSGRELAEIGFEEDVRLAAQVNAGQTVPHLVDGAYAPYSKQ